MLPGLTSGQFQREDSQIASDFDVLPPSTKECNSYISRNQTVSTLTKIVLKSINTFETK
jgi:hypothetical protein